MTTPHIEEIAKEVERQAEIRGWSAPNLEYVITTALTQTHQAGIDEERKRLAGLIKPRAQKFINKVDKGLARSKETYKDMHYIVDLLDDTIKALQDNK